MANDRKPTSIRLLDPEWTILEERESNFADRSEVIRRCLRRYAEVCRRDLPQLSVDEWRLVMDALNGCWMHDTPAHWAALEIADAISLNRLDTKWGVDGADLQRRLGALGHGGWVALVDAAERFWASSSRGEEARVPGETTTEEPTPASAAPDRER